MKMSVAPTGVIWTVICRVNGSEQNLCHCITGLMVLCFLCVQLAKWTSLESANNTNEVLFIGYRIYALREDDGKQPLKYSDKQKL